MLMASLPTTWLVVGMVLLVLLLVAVLLLVVKSREAYLLKKEVAELRETMLMMRYEEANLSRMLHKADKAEQIEAPTAEMLLAEVETGEAMESADEPEASEESEVTELIESSKPTEPTETVAPSELPELSELSENYENSKSSESSELVSPQESAMEDTAIEEPVDEESIPEEPVVEEPAAPLPRKHAINERRPAIPNDLFAAWFEEQDNQKSQEESLHEEVLVEQQAIEPVAADVNEAPLAELVMESAVKTPPTELTDTVVSSEPKVLSKEDEKFCRKLERIVHTRMHNPNLNVDVVAAQFGMGRTNFYRKVREITSMSPNDYLRQCRMERASELLRTTDLSVAEICGQVGIPDAQYFSRVFKSFYGTPPSAYREQQ